MKKSIIVLTVSLLCLISCKEYTVQENTTPTIEQPADIQPSKEQGSADKVVTLIHHLSFTPDAIKLNAIDRKADTSWPGDGCNCPSTLRSFRGEFQIAENGRTYGGEIVGETYLNTYKDVESPEQMDKKHLDTSVHYTDTDRLSYEKAKTLYQQILKNKNNLSISMVVTDQSNLGFLRVDSLVIRDKDSKKILWQAKQYEGHLWGNR